VAEFRSALRRFLRTTERNSRAAGLTPQRYLLLLMVKGAEDGSGRSTVTELVRRADEVGLLERERSPDDGRIAFLRLTPEGERRLERAFTTNEAERQALLDAFSYLKGTPLEVG